MDEEIPIRKHDLNIRIDETTLYNTLIPIILRSVLWGAGWVGVGGWGSGQNKILLITKYTECTQPQHQPNLQP